MKNDLSMLDGLNRLSREICERKLTSDEIAARLERRCTAR